MMPEIHPKVSIGREKVPDLLNQSKLGHFLPETTARENLLKHTRREMRIVVKKMHTFTNEKYGLTMISSKTNLQANNSANQSVLDEIAKPRTVTGLNRMVSTAPEQNDRLRKSAVDPETSRIMVMPKEAPTTFRSGTA